MDVVVGRVAKAHGIRGELVVDVRTDAPDERFADEAELTLRRKHGPSAALTVRSSRWHGNRLLVRFDQVGTREDADALRGCLLVVDTAELPPAEDPEEFYDHELIGLRAEHVDGASVGPVRDVVHGPSGELLVLDVDGHEVLVPFVRAIVPTVDVEGGRLVLDPPEGLLE